MSSKKVLKYAGYSIPEDLVYLTGGGPDDWAKISEYHLEMYRAYTPINDSDFILEVGCGVGRDAIELTKVLSKDGRYVGIDIIEPSITWAKQNITKKHKNFTFHYFDIKSQIHNNGGAISTKDIVLPAKDKSVDRIFLHSVFTHMFEEDIVHYLKEFNRVLKPGGLVLASFFILDKEALDRAHQGSGKKHRHPLTFEYTYGKGCYINDKEYPEGAVGYTPKKIKSMLNKSGLIIHGRHAHRGAWSGIKNSRNGQDILILEKASRREQLAQNSRPLEFTDR